MHTCTQQYLSWLCCISNLLPPPTLLFSAWLSLSCIWSWSLRLHSDTVVDRPPLGFQYDNQGWKKRSVFNPTPFLLGTVFSSHYMSLWLEILKGQPTWAPITISASCELPLSVVSRKLYSFNLASSFSLASTFILNLH